ISDADLLSNFIAERYAYLNDKNVDWSAAWPYYHGRYAAAGNDRGRFAVLEQMLDELYDPHSHLTSNYRDSWRLPAYDVWAEPRGGAFVVTEVRTESPAQKSGVRAGDELFSIDGRSVRGAVAARLPRFLRSSDSAAEQWALLSALSGRHDRSRVLEVGSGGKKRSIVIPISPSDDAAAAAVSSRTIGDVGYVSIRTFADSAIVAQFDTALEKIKSAKALIVDVRNNNGGDTDVMLPIAGRFLVKRAQYAWMARRSGAGLGPRWPEYIDPRGPWTYTGKVVVLVDRWSESVAEGFAMAMSETRGALVVGTPMAGLGAAVTKLHLPRNDVDAQISAEPVYSVDGKPRSSFVPSVLVDLTSAKGDDPILAAGLAALGSVRRQP
ncbi:MAG TPA: S41 family peptidase, partial [Candidatus Baltobacteraceae bacterium]|nr:S41 family peptidase [Candidatus Baltobacteraceae bacterium]